MDKSSVIKNIYKLTPMQEGMLYYYLEDEKSEMYFEQIEIQVEGDVNPDIIEKSLNILIDRHDVFRTVFRYQNVKQPVQIILKKRSSDYYYKDISNMNSGERLEYIEKFRGEDRKKGFDLSKDILLRLSLFKEDTKTYRIIFSLHHIIIDGWSIGIVLTEFFNIYSSIISNVSLELDNIYPYSNYMRWLENQDKKEAEQYWGNYLNNYNVQTCIPGNINIKDRAYEREEHNFIISEELVNSLTYLSNKLQVTLNTVIQALWGVILQKYNNTNDVIYGMVVSGRPADVEGIEKTVGLFINTIPMRVKYQEDEKFSALLKDVQDNMAKSEKYSYLPLAEIQSYSDLKRNLINNIMVIENYPINKSSQGLEECGLEIKDIDGFEQTNYNFSISFGPGEIIKVRIVYNSFMYDKDIICQIEGHINQAIKCVIHNPDIFIKDINILNEQESKRILLDFNKSGFGYINNKTIHKLFGEQVDRTPDNISLVYGETELSYREVNDRANHCACILRENGVSEGSIVGILFDRSVEMIIAILGVFKAGGAYLPIDPSQPKERILYMLEDSGSNILLTTTEVSKQVLHELLVQGDANKSNIALREKNEVHLNIITNCKVICIDLFEEHQHISNDFADCTGINSLAYIMYTSGSTGMPKGTLITHSNIARVVKDTNYINISKSDVVLQLSNYAFDGSVFDIFGALVNGAKLVLIEKDEMLDIYKLSEFIKEKGITVFFVTTALFNTIVDLNIKCFENVRKVLFGGERVSVTHVKKALSYMGKDRIIHVYGPTESTVYATFYNINEIDERSSTVPIGIPLRDTRIYIISREGQLQPAGAAGELCISGGGLSRGYLNRPELTAEKFVDNPFNTGEKIYKTGDIARWLPDGNIEFIGRIDNQVKIRGFRIELEEIELKLLKNSSVNQAVVVVREKESGEKYICAYLVLGTGTTIKKIRSYLTGELPEYMVPSYFIQLETIPLNKNGKVDKSSLPEPVGDVNTGVEYEAPRNEVEEKLALMWKEMLEVERVGINDNFFELGGHSLKATLLMSKIHKEFSSNIRLKDIFNSPTIRGLSEIIGKLVKKEYANIERAEKKEFYPVSSSQKRVYALNQMNANGTQYNVPMAMYIEGIFDKDRFEIVFKELARRHEALRTSFEMVEGKPVQRIYDEVDFNIDYIKEENEEKLAEISREFIRPFDLSIAPLIRVKLVEIREDKHMLLLDMHHIISDGVSMGILFKEIVDIYKGQNLSIPRIQYKDFAVWQNNYHKTNSIKEQEKYWLETLSGELPVLNMLTDYQRPLVQSFEGDRIRFRAGRDIVEELRRITADTGATMYMVLLSAYNILLSKYSRQEDIIVGTPIAGRPYADIEDVVGMFVNTLAMRNQPKRSLTFREFVIKVKENALKAYENQEYQFEELVDKVDWKRELGRNPIFDVMFAMQNVDIKEIDIKGLRLKLHELEYKIAKFDLTMSAIENGSDLEFDLEYCTKLYKKETVEILARHYINILRQVTECCDKKIKDIELLSEEERKMVLLDFNNTHTEYPRDKTIQELFEEQVEKFPDNTALVYGEKVLTYGELNEKANRLAWLLRDNKITVGSVVGIIAERSIEMIVGTIAVLKAGGAYLPIDPMFPHERIRHILKDSNVGILLRYGKSTEFMNDLGCDLEKIIDLADEGLYKGEGVNLTNVNTPRDLVYIIYTSGSTGKPKGVMVEHRNVVRVVRNTNYIYINEDDRILQLSNYAFDGSKFDIYGALLNGAALIMVENGESSDISKISKVIKEKDISVFFITTALFNVLVDINVKSLERVRKILFGGERVSLNHVRKALEHLGPDKMIHVYGPTESTVYATYYPVEKIENGALTIPIGKPLSNTKIYILDDERKPLPVGIAGELCIEGDGLARGYLNSPELTAEKFIENPLSPGQRIYRTGDLAKWLPDGSIEFIGRIDNQVKIRGFRIELGEIEAVLLKHESVKEAVVLAKEDKSGSRYLCAYIVLDREETTSELKLHLGHELPDYMIPQFFIRIEKMPLNQNGKIDKKLLPEPDGKIDTGVEYEAPRNEVEKKLVELWQEVLGVEKLGINDDFFELGGDSIKAIQLSARLKKYNFKIETKDLFANPTIKKLSMNVKSIEREGDQGIVKGEVSLTPIQSWYFNKGFTDEHHFNQTFMLYRKEGFEESAVRKAFDKILRHHDALRMVFRKEKGRVVQINRGVEGKLYDLESIDLIGKDEYENRIEEECNRIQGGIDLGNGPLVRLCIFKTSEGDHLLVVIHHLVIDMVSWRIVLEDFATGYMQALKNKEIKLPDKTDSYKLWADAIKEYSQGKKMEEEKEYWENLCSYKVVPLPKDNVVKSNRMKDNVSLTTTLSEEDTSKLLKQTNKIYNTEINDILLTALGLSIKEWTGEDNIFINLEGHGREDIKKDVDVSRTVGWFTTIFPIVLDMRKSEDLSYQIKTVKENLRRIPKKGIGYGVLKYFRGCLEGFDINPEISFNYLGQFGQDDHNKVFSVSELSTGMYSSPYMERFYRIHINCMVVNGKMMFTFNYNKDEYKEDTIKVLLQKYEKNLCRIIEHCGKKGSVELTPSDLGYSALSLEEYDEIKGVVGLDIKSICPLTPLQEGMLHHAIINELSKAYFEQISYSMSGSLDIDLLEKSLNIVIEKHEALRAIFVYERVRKPLQVILKSRQAKINYEDISWMESNDKKAYINEYKTKDKQNGFNLSKDLLLRMSVLKEDEQAYRLIWSFHHIIIDGWSMGIFVKDLFETYYALKKGMKVSTDEVYPYSNYIKWLNEREKKEASEYWDKYLEGYNQRVSVPKKNYVNKADGYKQEQLSFVLDKEQTEKLTRIAKSCQSTLNTIIQLIWSILLQKYNGTEDVVYGTVVSGRPSELAGVETTVGLFINTIPIRIKCGGKEKFLSVATELQKSSLKSEMYSYYPLVEIQSHSQLKRELIDHLFVFENYPVDKEVNSVDESELKVDGVEVFEQTSYDFNILIAPGSITKILIKYNTFVYEADFVRMIEGHFREVAKHIINNPDVLIQDINILSKEEEQKILTSFNDTQMDYPRDKAIHELFEEQVEKTPRNIAVICKEEKLTYRELNQKANQIAWLLREKGIKPGSIVGIMVGRSIEMIVGTIAVLKAGGAYLPIDPNYPQDRIEYMLRDSNAIVLLTQAEFEKKVMFSGNIIVLDKQFDPNSDVCDLKVENRADDLAYVIYTSGSTGKPKGVMIEHKSAVNTLIALQRMYPLSEEDTYLLKTSYTFDVSVAELFGWFFAGGKLSILEPGGEKYPETIIQAIKKDCITHINFAPSMLNAFLDMLNKESVEILEGLKYVFVAGEAISVETVRKFKDMIKGVRLENIYGPTETSIYATKYSIDSVDNKIKVPIGVPIQNTRAYIVDSRLNLQPIGVFGELCVSGEGLSRGYLNRPELTDEKFIDNPFEPGRKLYRTGDLARWMPDGNIEFIGRIDNQVKVRGSRIELGEIEARLLKHELIKEAVVVAKEDTDESKYLCAYMVSDAKIDVWELRLHLAKELPEYMIPQYFVRIEKMPLNQSGKIDRKSLPEPDGYVDTEVEYEAPRNEVEVKLSEIWQEVLGVEKVGINDNFFELGGDSIKAIQVSARMQRYQLKVETKDLLANPTISILSGYVKKTTSEIYQGIVDGEVELTPVQRWYFEKEFTDEHHFNQAFMLHRKDGFEENAVKKAFDKILEHHDALRMTFRRENGGVIQLNRGIEGKLYDIETVDLTGIEEYESKMEEVCNKIQGSIDLCDGPLVKLCLFRTSRGDHMLIAIHHLVVDGVSWRVIFEDFAFGYMQALENKGIELPQKTDSYKEWAGKIREYAQGREIEEEREYWEKVCSYKVMPLPKDNEAKSNRIKDNVSHIVTLTEEDTNKLLKQVNKAYNTEINDILLAALGLTIKEWTGEDNIFINLEGHGREDIKKDIDISRTVGWFTTMYPIVLDMRKSEDLSYQIKMVKENLRRIPKKGIGYGVLKYLRGSSEGFDINPEISFNYLGQFDQEAQNEAFSMSTLSSGISSSLSMERPYAVNINGMVMDNKMMFIFGFNKYEYEEATISRLTQNYLENIYKIIAHCEKKDHVDVTPSDLGCSRVSLEELEDIKDMIGENLSF